GIKVCSDLPGMGCKYRCGGCKTDQALNLGENRTSQCGDGFELMIKDKIEINKEKIEINKIKAIGSVNCVTTNIEFRTKDGEGQHDKMICGYQSLRSLQLDWQKIVRKEGYCYVVICLEPFRGYDFEVWTVQPQTYAERTYAWIDAGIYNSNLIVKQNE
ncbi:MAG: hypothetical protein Q7R95_03415, partial [bacterium]|nr:hypothetical protein [bacterium]